MRILVTQGPLRTRLLAIDSNLDVTVSFPAAVGATLACETTDLLVVDLAHLPSMPEGMLPEIARRHPGLRLVLLTDMSDDGCRRFGELLESIAPNVLLGRSDDLRLALHTALASVPTTRLSATLIGQLSEPLSRLRARLRDALTHVLMKPGRYTVPNVSARANLSRRPMEREVRAAGLRSLGSVLRTSWMAHAYIGICAKDFTLHQAAADLDFACDRSLRAHFRSLLGVATEASIRSIDAEAFGLLLCANLLRESTVPMAHRARSSVTRSRATVPPTAFAADTAYPAAFAPHRDATVHCPPPPHEQGSAHDTATVRHPLVWQSMVEVESCNSAVSSPAGCSRRA